MSSYILNRLSFGGVALVFVALLLAGPLAPRAFALSQQQLDAINQGIYYFNVDDNSIGAGLGGAIGSTCYSAALPAVNDPNGLANAINSFIRNNGGSSAPLAGMGQQIVEGSMRAGVNPFLVTAIARKESGFGAQIPGGSNNSFGRTASASQPHVSASGRDWYQWSSFAASVDSTTENDEPTYLQQEYVSQGLTTIPSLILKYAPPSENDTARYVQDLNQWIDELITAAGGSITCNVTGSASTGNFVIYSQYDPRWTNKPYGSSGDIGASGCGPSSMAIVVTNLTGQVVTPDIIASRFSSFHIAGQGSSSGLFPAVAQYYGLTPKLIGTDLTAAARALANGALVIATGQGSSPFTGSGHILTLRGINSDGKFLLGDPNTKVPPEQDPENTTPISGNKIIAAGLQSLWVISK